MATSDYKQYINTIVSSYVGKLIHCITQVDESSENFVIAEKFAKSNLLYHKFLETNKNDIQRGVQGLIEKLSIHSQSEKAERLGYLVQRFLTKPLKNDVSDVHYAVLSLLMNLSTNPLESVYYTTKFKERNDEPSGLDEQFIKDLNMEDEIREQWRYSDQESIDEESDEESFEEREEDDEHKNKSIYNPAAVPTPKQSELKNKSGLKTLSVNDIRGDSKIIPKNQPNVSLSAIDKSLIFGTLPMQSYGSLSGLGLFNLPNKQTPHTDGRQLLDQSLNNKSTMMKESQISILPSKKHNISKETNNYPQKVAEKRNYSQLMAEDELANSTNVTFELDNYEADKQFLEKTALQPDIWKNPNFLNETLKDHYLNPDEKGRSRSEITGLSHWPFAMKTERALIQDILLMLIGVESETFVKNDHQMFEKRLPFQLSHTSPEALIQTVHKFILLSNSIFEISSNCKILRTNFTTTVVEGYLECLDEYMIEYKGFIEDVQCIFLKQACQVKMKNVDIKNSELKRFLEKDAITLMELLEILSPFMRNFKMILEINQHLVGTFQNAVNSVEEVVREETTPANSTEVKPFISMVTLSYLYRLLTETIVGANDESANRLLFKLFFKSWEPYLEILDKWLRSGTLMDRYSEFFIKCGKDINVLSNFYLKINWNTDYVYQTYSVKWRLLNEEKTFVCVPNFLSKYADIVSTIGRTIKVLGYLIHQENLYLYLNKLDFKEQFFTNLTSKIDEEELFSRLKLETAAMTVDNSTSIKNKAPVRIKDYTFGARLKNQSSLKAKAGEKSRQNILSKGAAKNIDQYMNSTELSKFSIKAFTIQDSLSGSSDTKSQTENKGDGEERVVLGCDNVQINGNIDVDRNKSTSKFYNKVLAKGNQESLNNLKIYLDSEIESLLVNMESHYSAQLTDLLFNHFHLNEHLRILRIVFFLQNEPILEPFLHEALLKVRTSLLDNNLVRLNQILKDSMSKIKGSSINNIASLFTVENEPKDEHLYNSVIMNNFYIAFKPVYPLDIIFDDEVVRLYNRIFRFILQIKRAKISLTINGASIKKDFVCESIQKPKKSHKTEYMYDEEEENYSRDGNDNSLEDMAEVVDKINVLKRKFCLAQRELLHFVNNLEFFVGYSVIEEYTKKYQENIQESKNITEIHQKLKEYLYKIVEICQLQQKKNNMLLELIKSSLNLCWDYYNIYNRLEERCNFISTMTSSETLLENLSNELEILMNNFRDNNKMIMQILNQYQQKGHKLQIKSLFMNLNYNQYYMSETDDYLR